MPCRCRLHLHSKIQKKKGLSDLGRRASASYPDIVPSTSLNSSPRLSRAPPGSHRVPRGRRGVLPLHPPRHQPHRHRRDHSRLHQVSVGDAQVLEKQRGVKNEERKKVFKKNLSLSPSFSRVREGLHAQHTRRRTSRRTHFSH